jgi:hypothetical protein
MGWRVCSCTGCAAHPGSCPTVHGKSGRCPDCRRQADAARGRPAERGYDGDYIRARAAAVTGATHCGTCGEAFAEDNPATGGHVKAIRDGGTVGDGIVAECRRCNYGWRRGLSR